jgi:hypothetical protein
LHHAAGIDNGYINAAFVVRNVDSPVLLPLLGNEYRGEQPAPDDDLLLDVERDPVLSTASMMQARISMPSARRLS